MICIFLCLFSSICTYRLLCRVIILTIIINTNIIHIRIRLSLAPTQQQDLPTLSEEELSSQRNRSSLVVNTSEIQTSSSLEDIIRDIMKKEIKKLTSEMKDPIQQAVYQSFEHFISNEHSKHEGLVSEEVVELKSSENDPRREISRHRKSVQKSSHDWKKMILRLNKKKTMFGVIFIHSKGYGVSCYENLYMFHPAAWLIWLGMQSSLDILISKSIRGWKNNLSSRTFRAVSNDASIFQLCRGGNTDEIRTLFAKGEASVMDRNSHGMTPLHVSIVLFV